MAKYVGFVTIGTDQSMPIAATLYGVCGSDIAIDANPKLVTLDALTNITAGVTVRVKFINGNNKSDLKLRFTGMSSDTTGIAVKNYGSGSSLSFAANSVISFTYDGTNWVMHDANTTYSTLTQTIVDTGTETSGKLVTAKIIKDTITNAIGNLDVSNITANLGAGKTITALSEENGKISATASNIAITESQVTNLTTDLGAKMPKDGGQFTGNVSFASGKTLTVNTPTSDSHAATKKYVDDKTAGLSGAMHFKGSTTSTITDGGTQTVTIDSVNLSPISGDVVLSGDKEFVWTGSKWELLGDEGSYALKTITITGSNGLTGGGAISSNQVISHASRPATSATADETFGNSTSRYYIKQIKVDSYGHIIDVTTGNETVTNVDTKLRTYASATNVELPLIGLNQGNGTASYTSFTSGSKDVYGAIPSTAANVATINPSTGIITAPGFKGVLQATDVKTALSYDSSTAATTLSFLHKSGNWKTISLKYTANNSSGAVVTGVTHTGASFPTLSGGVATTASVSNGVLTITAGSNASLSGGSFGTVSMTKSDIAIQAT